MGWDFFFSWAFAAVHVHAYHASVFGDALFTMFYENFLAKNDPFMVTGFCHHAVRRGIASGLAMPLKVALPAMARAIRRFEFCGK